MNDTVLADIRAHAEQAYPRECCGLVLVWKGREQYRPCTNIAAGASHFQISAQEYAAHEEDGEIVAIVHSHPNESPVPSQPDRVGCEASGLPWIIMNWPTGQWQRIEPTGYVAPLVGRVFCFGVLDCYSLIRDYYARELRITLPDFPRQDGFWHRGEQLYLENFTKAGFARVPDASLRRHDVLLMQLGSPVVNHGAIYLGDDRILHHPMHRLSGREVYGGYWQHITVQTIRHEALR